MSYLYNSNVSIDDIINGKVFSSPIDLQPMNFNSRTNSPGYDRYVVSTIELYKYYENCSKEQRKQRRRWLMDICLECTSTFWEQTKHMKISMRDAQYRHLHFSHRNELNGLKEEIAFLD